MAIRKADINRNADGTWTVRVGRQIEHIDPIGKDRGEVFEAIRYALISKDVPVQEIELIEIMWSEGS